MDKVFYIMYAFAIWHELEKSARPMEAKNSINKIKTDLEKDRDKAFKDHSGVIILQMGYAIMTIVGLFTFQWYAFAGMLLLSAIPKRKAWAIRIDAILSIFIILFIVVNKFHFHYIPF